MGGVMGLSSTKKTTDELVNEEITLAIEAEQKRRKMPPLTTVANLIRREKIDSLDASTRWRLADFLQGY
jgi:hypothetical protein